MDFNEGDLRSPVLTPQTKHRVQRSSKFTCTKYCLDYQENHMRKLLDRGTAQRLIM